MKHKLSAIALAYGLAAALGTAGTAFAQTGVDIQQTGGGNLAYAEQNASATSQATIVQKGNDNRAGDPDAGVVGESGILQTNTQNSSAQVRQAGRANTGLVVQEDTVNKYGMVSQTGNRNLGAVIQQGGGTGGGASLTQTGRNHAGVITQYGDEGVVSVTQDGIRNFAEIAQRPHISRSQFQDPTGSISLLQRGEGNTSVIVQSSPGGAVAVSQFGNLNSAKVSQSGGFGGFYPERTSTAQISQQGVANNAELSQTGIHGRAAIEQRGNGNDASLAATSFVGGDARIRQSGDGNRSFLAQYGPSASIGSIEQHGYRHYAAVQQIGIYGSTARVIQVGEGNAATIQQDDHNEASILQLGLRNQALVDQVGGTSADARNVARIDQQGNDFRASIYQNGTGNRAGIRQR